MRGNNNQIASLINVFIVAAIGISILQEFSSYSGGTDQSKSQPNPSQNQNYKPHT